MGGLGASPDTYLRTWAAAAVSTYLSGGPPLPGGLPSTSHPFPMAEAGPNSSSPSTRRPSPPPQPGQGGIPFVPLQTEPRLVMRKAISDQFKFFHVAPLPPPGHQHRPPPPTPPATPRDEQGLRAACRALGGLCRWRVTGSVPYSRRRLSFFKEGMVGGGEAARKGEGRGPLGSPQDECKYKVLALLSPPKHRRLINPFNLHSKHRHYCHALCTDEDTRPREVKQLAQGHTARRSEQGLHPGSLALCSCVTFLL